MVCVIQNIIIVYSDLKIYETLKMLMNAQESKSKVSHISQLKTQGTKGGISPPNEK